MFESVSSPFFVDMAGDITVLAVSIEETWLYYIPLGL